MQIIETFFLGGDQVDEEIALKTTMADGFRKNGNGDTGGKTRRKAKSAGPERHLATSGGTRAG